MWNLENIEIKFGKHTNSSLNKILKNTHEKWNGILISALEIKNFYLEFFYFFFLFLEI